MADAYEVILEEVPARNLLPLLVNLETKAGRIFDIAVSEPLEISEGGGINRGLIASLIKCQEAACITGRMCHLAISEEICLPVVFLRIIKYKEGIDVELSFDDSGHLDIDAVMLAMQRYASALSKKFRIPVIYGGLEPAADVETRYFTNDV